ncbi:MAG TPA: glycosyltransferase family 39 protein [Planctomycetota bacterium]|nr:glycosyltransferase family 39 protein [Planctomycetota bacterium]
MQTQRLSWRDPPLRWLLLLTLGLTIWSWWMQRGYPLADAVEFMDRAKSWVAGEPLSDARTVRSFAFSLAFVPPFALARALHLEDLRVILVAARLFEVALTLGLVVACARLGERVAGRTAGLAVGCVVALNPTVLQYSVHPISGIAAALCIALGLERLIVRGDRRDGLIGGLWFGLAFLMAYQSLLVALAVFVVLVARDRWSARASWLGIAAGLVVAMSVQLVLDRVVYGSWQGSLWRYLLENVGYVIVHFLTEVGASRAAGELYRQISALRGQVYVTDDSITHATMRFGPLWYVISAPRFFVWPLLALFLAGVMRAFMRPMWTSTLSVLALVMVLMIMAKKGDKSLRLCLPLIPLCVPLFAVAREWLAERASSRWIASFALVAALPLVLIAFTSARPRANSAYWDAADWIDARANESPADSRTRVASAYDWAVFLRFGAHVQATKLPEPLDRWKKLSEPERERELAAIDTADWLIVHQPLLTAQPDLAQLLAPRFEVAAAFYDQDEAPELGAVLVLQRSGHGGARLFEYSTSAPTPRNPHELEFKSDASSEPLIFLGHDLARMPGSDWWWITYHWKLPSEFIELEVRDRISAPDEKHTWQNDHALGRGSRPPNQDARYLSEGYLFVPSDVELGAAPKFRALGGSYRRGDLIPVRLWFEVRDIASDRALEVFRDDASVPVRSEFADATWRWTADGYRFSKDDLVQAASFFLPVHPRAFAREDGKPIPE